MNTVKILHRGDTAYPDHLRELGDEAPENLYCLGDTDLLRKRSVAVVGARKASEYGKWAAYRSGETLAECGLVTVSGMAYGCDEHAHRGALHGGGKTIAVLAGGVDVCYPKSNRKLYERIIKEGLILSENPPGTPPMRHLFPRRNRIISGISEMVVIAEAAEHSGSLITAGFALEQGRDIMAYPFNANIAAGRGNNLLIRDGAVPVTDPEDIIFQMGMEKCFLKKNETEGLKGPESAVLQIIREAGSLTADEICEKSGLDIRGINAVISLLELRGLVYRTGGRIYTAK